MPAPIPFPRVPPGTVLDLAECDYKYGEGRLLFRVDEVVGVVRLWDGAWLHVGGVEIRWNGVEHGPRDVLVRMSALRGAIRTPPEE